MIEFHDVELSTGLGGLQTSHNGHRRPPCQHKRPSVYVLAWWGFLRATQWQNMLQLGDSLPEFTPRVYPGTPKFTLEFTLEPENYPLMAPLWLGEQLLSATTSLTGTPHRRRCSKTPKMVEGRPAKPYFWGSAHHDLTRAFVR